MLHSHILWKDDIAVMYHSGTGEYYQVKVLRHVSTEEIIQEEEFLESQGA